MYAESSRAAPPYLGLAHMHPHALCTHTTGDGGAGGSSWNFPCLHTTLLKFQLLPPAPPHYPFTRVVFSFRICLIMRGWHVLYRGSRAYCVCVACQVWALTHPVQAYEKDAAVGQRNYSD